MKRTVQHETDAAGQRLLQSAFEGFGWVVNGIKNDYGADYEVEIFEGGQSTGIAFKVQLKSSASTKYSAGGAVVSQRFRVANARYLTHELRIPTVVVHCDVANSRAYWLMPQLDATLASRLHDLDDDQTVTLRLPVVNALPASRAAFEEALLRADAALSVRTTRRVQPALVSTLGASVLGSDIDAVIRAYQAHSDALRLTQAHTLLLAGDLDKTFDLVRQLLEAPSSAIEDKFKAWIIWESAEQNRQISAGLSDRSRVAIGTRVAGELQKLAKRGPAHLKYYAAVLALAARVRELSHDGHVLNMAARVAVEASPMFQLSRQQLDRRLDLTLIRSSRIINRLLRTREAWVLPRVLPRLAMSVGVACLRFEHERRDDAVQNLKQYGLELCRVAARVAAMTGDQNCLASAASGSLVFSRSASDEAMVFATEIASQLTSADERAFVEGVIEKRTRMNAGERVEGKIKTTARQIAENIEDGLRFVERQPRPESTSKQREG